VADLDADAAEDEGEATLYSLPSLLIGPEKMGFLGNKSVGSPAVATLCRTAVTGEEEEGRRGESVNEMHSRAERRQWPIPKALSSGPFCSPLVHSGFSQLRFGLLTWTSTYAISSYSVV